MAEKVKIFSRFNVPVSSGLACEEGSSMTQQHFKDECDINYLLKHYNDIPAPPAVYGDCSQYSDLQTAIDMVNAASEDFQNVPSEIRSRFSNNPVDFFNFCNDSRNYEELVKLGLATSRNSSLDVTVPTDTNSAETISSKEGE